MKTILTHIAILVLVVSIHPINANIFPDEEVNLYSVKLTSVNDADYMTSNGFEAILRGSNFVYLVPMSPADAVELSGMGIETNLLIEDFDRNDWMLYLPEHGAYDNLEDKSIEMSRASVKAPGITLVRRTEVESLGGSGMDEEFIKLPKFKIPFVYRVERLLGDVVTDPEIIDSILSMVSIDSIESYVRRLEAFKTRYTYSDSIISAQNWLMERYEALGCDVTIDTFELQNEAPYGPMGFNVVADLKGSELPDNYVILCNHYDAIASGNPVEAAPGADDNASGTAFCLEIARVLREFDLVKTLRFISFSSEEQGLVGSYGYVANNEGQDIEIVINADMIAYTSDYIPDVTIYQYEKSYPYYTFIANKMTEYTDLIPSAAGGSGRSDHYPFVQAGYRGLFVHEGDFNTPNYHSITDLADNLNFEYMVKVVKSCAVAAYEIAVAPPIIDSLRIVNLGKADRLRVEWEHVDCNCDLNYIVAVGTQSGVYDVSYSVPKGTNSYVIEDLTEGVQYFVAVGVTFGEDLESVVAPEVNGIPVAQPDTPSWIEAESGYRTISVSWGESSHQDVVEYKVFCKKPVGDFEYIASVADTGFVDTVPVPGEQYSYFVMAVDEDSNESLPSDTVTQGALYFDKQALVVVTPAIHYLEDTNVAMDKYRNFFADIRYDMFILGDAPLDINDFGRYRNVFWIDDDYANVGTYFDDLDAVSAWGCNLAFFGPLAGSGLAFADGEWFGLQSTVLTLFNPDSSEATSGWPEIAPDRSIYSKFCGKDIYSDYLLMMRFAYDPGMSSTLYSIKGMDGTYGDVGVIAEDDTLKTILLALPLFHLTDGSGRALINKIADEFGIPRNVAGDINDDAWYSLYDAVKMIQILYADAEIPDDINRLDVNNDCSLDILDVQYLISYIFAGGPEPTYGCIE